MEMFLMVMVLSLLGVGVSALLFAAATRDQAGRPTGSTAPRVTPERPRFFIPRAEAGDGPWAAEPPLTAELPLTAEQLARTEMLLAQLETHIRREQAAAESFVHSPTPAALYGRVTSPRLN
jgi:hypothetical protein